MCGREWKNGRVGCQWSGSAARRGRGGGEGGCQRDTAEKPRIERESEEKPGENPTWRMSEENAVGTCCHGNGLQVAAILATVTQMAPAAALFLDID